MYYSAGNYEAYTVAAIDIAVYNGSSRKPGGI